MASAAPAARVSRRRPRRRGRRRGRARRRRLGRRLNVLRDIGARTQRIERIVLVGDVHAAGLVGPDLDRIGVGPDQRHLVGRGGGRGRVFCPLVIGEPQPAGEHRHHPDRQQHPRQQPARPVFFALRRRLLGIVEALVRIDVPELIGHAYISSAGVTPKTASPDATTIAAPRTSARRARVKSGSPEMMKRSCASSLPFVHSR